MEDGASPSHLRCSLCWITILRTAAERHSGSKAAGFWAALDGWYRKNQEQAGNAESSKPRQWILKLGKAFLEAFVCMWKMFLHGLIMNPWFSAGVLKNYESFRGWSLTGGGLWGLLAQPLFVCSLLVLAWEVRGVGYMLFPPWLP